MKIDDLIRDLQLKKRHLQSLDDKTQTIQARFYYKKKSQTQYDKIVDLGKRIIFLKGLRGAMVKNAIYDQENRQR